MVQRRRGTSLISIGAEGAARSIIRATRRRDAEKILSLPGAGHGARACSPSLFEPETIDRRQSTASFRLKESATVDPHRRRHAKRDELALVGDVDSTRANRRQVSESAILRVT